ncbi:MAG: hypothetical protein CO098_00420 [Bacteroidetes bacterium CG_4_9_14_3_um_filter_41_19]|nr:MAG: hypothetical protein CO098_00420 [Bacteroidetes bacterium CG_4_9_14_3_um_filter_41_19]
MPFHFIFDYSFFIYEIQKCHEYNNKILENRVTSRIDYLRSAKQNFRLSADCTKRMFHAIPNP